jgi:tetratricopeptide (TPR) repeat protein
MLIVLRMAKRPRQHEIEGESIRAFASALPSAWVPRRQDPDYGIDLTVEVFEDGQSTGLVFNAQLKGTDEPDLGKALRSLRLERDKVEYYGSQNLPVLIVRHHAPTNRFFVRWFHSYDPHVEAGARGQEQEPASIAFRFDENDEWTEQSAAEVVEGLRGFLRFRQAEHQLPLPLIIAPSDAVDAQLVAADVRRALSDSQGIVLVEHRQPKYLDAHVEIAREKVRISLAGVASTTIHFDPELGTPDWLAPNIALGFAVALTAVGQTNLAAQIAAIVGEKGDLWADPWCCMTLAGAFYRSRRLREALEVSDRLDQSDNDAAGVAAYMLLSVLLAHGPDLSTADQATAMGVQGKRFRRRLDRDDRSGAAAEAYNMAMLNKRLKDKAVAKEWFERAAELDPSYLDRGYFHSDLAGVLFLNGDEEGAASHYLRAVELGADTHTKALAADALLFAGRYQAAEEMFEQYLAEVGDGNFEDAEWRLKARVLPDLISVAGSEQRRQAQKAREQVEPIDFVNGPGMEVGEAMERIRKSLALDACCGWAWFCSSLFALAASGDRAAGVQDAVIASLLNERDLNAWGNAIRLADERDEPFVLDLVRVAYRFLGVELEQCVLAIAGDVNPGHGGVLRRLLEQAVQEKALTTARAGFTMRYPGLDGGMKEISVEPPSTGDSAREQDPPVVPERTSSGLDSEENPAAEELFAELRRRLGNAWFEEAGSQSVEVTEEGDLVIHTGKWISFMWGKEESEGMILALHRAQHPAHISIVHEDGRFEILGPVDIDAG